MPSLAERASSARAEAEREEQQALAVEAEDPVRASVHRQLAAFWRKQEAWYKERIAGGEE